MGLDMYLTRRIYIDPRYNILITKNGQPADIDCSKISHVIEEIGYWRKANSIHNWFVQHVQDGKDDCGNYYVSPDMLKELITDCETVLNDPKSGRDILPTASGFFFGSTEYDDYYLDDLANTVKICKKALELVTEGGSIYYQSSW